MDHQGVGVSWECAASGHGGCHLAGCRCACHYRLGAKEDKSLIDRVQTDINRVATPPMEDPLVGAMSAGAKDAGPGPGPTCPKCGSRGREGDKFCRRDGTAIGITHCGQCGIVNDAGDAYCAGCGASLSAEIAVRSARPRRKRSDEGHGNGAGG